MEFKEQESFSPMKNNIIDQSSRIYEIISNAAKFKKYYNELVNNIVDSMNNQCCSYERNSKKSIKIDVYDNVMENIDWNGLQNKLVTDLKQNKNVVGDENLIWNDIGDVKGFSIEKYDIDPIINMYSNYGEESVKEYAQYMKEAINNLNEVGSSIDEFERCLCDFRTNAIKIILEKNIPVLYEIHYKYVKNLMNKKKGKRRLNGDSNGGSGGDGESVVLNGIKIELKRSQKEFFTSSLKKLIVNN